MILKPILIKLHWLLASQFGLDPRIFLRSLRGLPMYLCDWIAFRKTYEGSMRFMPCLHDRYEEGGVTKSEYFWQDLLVARWIAQANPQLHVDVGSRLDGFVAHVASFRSIEVFDVRPISTSIPGIVFKQADFMQSISLLDAAGGYCDSLSCLHALEHFGLGRYGDPIDPLGHAKGITNMAVLLKSGGIFYLSVPIGRERVEFNANRVFDPRTILSLATSNGLVLQSLTVVANGQPQELTPDIETLYRLATMDYSLGIFVFFRR